MFPSVLCAQAEAFMKPDGIYSSRQGTRLRTISSDWSGIDESLQAAAEHMTPAVLPGYFGFGHPQSSMAYVQQARQSQTPGFLTFGLSIEALACLDHLYEEGGPRYLVDRKRRTGEDRMWKTTELVREKVKVRIDVVGGETVAVYADTYAANTRALGASHVMEPRDMNQFLQCRSFIRLTDSTDHGRRFAEERSVANSLGTNLVLVGDRIVEKVMNDDYEGLESVLEEGIYINAPSARHGTVLQAAANQGNVRIMQSLLDAGADVNDAGGQ